MLWQTKSSNAALKTRSHEVSPGLGILPRRGPVLGLQLDCTWPGAQHLASHNQLRADILQLVVLSAQRHALRSQRHALRSDCLQKEKLKLTFQAPRPSSDDAACTEACGTFCAGTTLLLPADFRRVENRDS